MQQENSDISEQLRNSEEEKSSTEDSLKMAKEEIGILKSSKESEIQHSSQAEHRYQKLKVHKKGCQVLFLFHK